MAAFPKRGEIYLMKINPVTGEAGPAPAVVLQNNVGNEFARTVIVAPVAIGVESSFDLEIPVPAAESGLREEGVARLDKLYTVEKELLAEKTGRVSAETLSALERGLAISLGLSEF